MNNRKQWYLIVLIVFSLAIILTVLLHLQERARIETEDLHIIRGDDLIVLSAEYLEAVPAAGIEISDREILQGYYVSDLLSYASIPEDEYNMVYFTARDGSRLVVSREEIVEHRVSLIPQDNRTETFRLVFPEDAYRNRWLKDIVFMEIR